MKFIPKLQIYTLVKMENIVLVVASNSDSKNFWSNSSLIFVEFSLSKLYAASFINVRNVFLYLTHCFKFN